MEYSISTEDRTHFKCFKFPDGAVYYGEIAYVDPSNKIVRFVLLPALDHKHPAIQPRRNL